MYTEHPTFNAPPQDAILWRYLDFAKFVSLLDSSALFFARVDKLGDPFEGTLSRVNLAMEPVLYPDLSPDKSRALHNSLMNLRRYHAVNCWHWNEHESAAMWALYGHEQGGVAIKTTFSSLAACFIDPVEIYIGQIEYVDYNGTFIPENNVFSAYLHKRKSFEHEREIRAMIAQMPPDTTQGIHPGLPDVWETGRNCAVDLETLVHEVVVSPLAPNWFIQLVSSVASKYNLRAPVRHSTLAETPYWG